MTITALFSAELRRAEAAELARAGDYDTAARILAPLTDPAAQDLLARVHAQRGDLAAADATWRQILATDPRNTSALAGTQLIADIVAGKRRKRPLPVAAIGTGAAAVVVAAGVAVLVTLPGNATPVTGARTITATPLAAPPVAITPTPPGPMTTGPTVTVTTSPVPRSAGDLLSLVDSLRAPGVRVSQQGDQVSVVFDDGLFAANGSGLTASGRRQLVAWGQLLTGKNVRITVLGHGLAVGPGPATGGSTVALGRAVTAAQALSQASGLPMTAFAAASADQSAAPHPGAPDKNRTVTVLVTPGG